jgi:signal peptidase I
MDIEKIKKRFKERILKNRRFYAVLAVGIVFWTGSLYAFKSKYDFHVNLTPSLPFTFLITEREFDESALQKHTIVQFKLGFDSPYPMYKHDSMFAKRLGCMPGERLRVDGLGYYCNEELMGVALVKDSKGKPIPKYFSFNGTVPNGKYFMLGDHSHSYDSRYWGLLDENEIMGVEIWHW